MYAHLFWHKSNCLIHKKIYDYHLLALLIKLGIVRGNMRILIIIDTIDNGGCGIVLKNLLSNINLEKYKIDVITFEENSNYESLLPSNVNIRHIYKKNPAKHSNKFVRYFYGYAKEKCPKWLLRWIFIKDNYDLAIDFKGNNLNLLTAMKCPKIFWSHKDFSPETTPIEKKVIEEYSKTRTGFFKERRAKKEK